MNKRRLSQVVLILLVLTLALVGCAPKPKVGIINGVIKRAGNLPLAGAIVSIEKAGEPLVKAVLNEAGAFSLSVSEVGTYDVKITVGEDVVHTAPVDMTKLEKVTLPATTVELVDGVVYAQDFELIEAGKMPLDWTIFSGDGGQLSTEFALSGTKSWKLAVTDGTLGIRTTPIPVTPGMHYKGSAYFRKNTVGSTATLYVEYLDENKKRIASDMAWWARPASEEAETWQYVEIQSAVVAPANAKYVALICYYPSGAGKMSWIDDVKVQELPAE